MNTIKLKGVVPEIFASNKELRSEVWLSDVEFEQGKRYLIKADSGTGKSSLLSYIYGQRGDYRGDILFNDQNILTLSSHDWCMIRQSMLSILFQDLKLFGELTALENVEIKNRLTKTQPTRIIKGWFEELGIADKLKTRADHLSYGQQQRVALIRALCQPFNFLLLDEPISHLDDRNSEVMRDIIIREATRQGAGIIATSIGKHMDMEYNKILSL
ncbi:MAG: ATP-binding cassette domain-containing protein [Alistipes sp.]|nr:ATP-binding cassette domain-containing protein [Alistipes sp.]MBO7285906.1 ATP-binding cassette domain-containing protein [Alistipes sp.]